MPFIDGEQFDVKDEGVAANHSLFACMYTFFSLYN